MWGAAIGIGLGAIRGAAQGGKYNRITYKDTPESQMAQDYWKRLYSGVDQGKLLPAQRHQYGGARAEADRKLLNETAQYFAGGRSGGGGAGRSFDVVADAEFAKRKALGDAYANQHLSNQEQRVRGYTKKALEHNPNVTQEGPGVAESAFAGATGQAINSLSEYAGNKDWGKQDQPYTPQEPPSVLAPTQPSGDYSILGKQKNPNPWNISAINKY